MIRIVAGQAGQRADKLVAEEFPNRGRKRLAGLFANGHVRVNGHKAKKGQLLAAGDVVELEQAPPDDNDLRPVPELAPIEVLHEDADIVCASKPPGVPSHPLRAGERGTLANAIVARFPECRLAGDDPREGGLVNRLDTGTSGIIVAARSPGAWRAVRDLFHRGHVTKDYLALVHGCLGDAGTIDEPVWHRGDRMVIHARGLPAVTHYEPQERFSSHTLVRCISTTGRMDQIRVHLAHLGHPLVGDVLYGASRNDLPVIGHFLHAKTICLPLERKDLRIEAPLPEDRRRALEILRSQRR